MKPDIFKLCQKECILRLMTSTDVCLLDLLWICLLSEVHNIGYSADIRGANWKSIK